MLHVSSFRMNDKIETEVEIESISLRRLGGRVPCERVGLLAISF